MLVYAKVIQKIERDDEELDAKKFIQVTFEQSAAINSAVNTCRDLCFSFSYRSLHCSIDVAAMSAQIT